MNGGIVHDLLSAVTPEPTRIDWGRVEGWLGTALPTAYRQIADRFGSLLVGDWLWIHAPVRLAGYPTFDKELAGIRFEARDACDAARLPAPRFHPKRGGLLPFGSGRGGEGLFWDTAAGAPEEWPVVVLAHAPGAYGNAGWIHSGRTLVPFLEALVTTGVGQGGHSLGPLPARIDRAYGGRATSYWTPPDRAARSDPRRKGLTSGAGLNALQVLVPPPEGREPSVVDEGLPGDYRALMAAYGPGAWRGWLRVWHPDDLGSSMGRPFLDPVAGSGEVDFLPFADSIDGDVLGWVREGPPDRWPLAWVPRHSDPGQAMRVTFTAALLAWLRGTPVDGVFGAHDPDVDLVDQATFAPRESA
ncbi:SMI1/KNR4 family protein [uncultured Nocardioides sp.]|uniref:SMI1/KNR4 family protein n=1 Tax=uncultured Nocardioides sp. TaxID=198441 RepID=UPI0026229900|nr:SMI1/KNR4 family protein [uncultured Nocardioides sp.]